MTDPALYAHTAAIILAAGKGTRMKSTVTNKVALPLKGQPLIVYSVSTLKQLPLAQLVVVVGFASASVTRILGRSVTYAYQKKRLGTAHALKCGLYRLAAGLTTVISVYGDDSAFYPPSLYTRLLTVHHRHQAKVTVLTIERTNPTGLGRIIRDSKGQIQKIVEEKNASPSEKLITEINTGLYCFHLPWLRSALPKITKNPVSQEYYLTDIIEVARRQEEPVKALQWPDPRIWHGVNTPVELLAAETGLQA